MENFCGKFEVCRRENLEPFMTGIGVPEEYIEQAKNAKVTIDVEKKGDAYEVTRVRPHGTQKNTIRLGEECEVDTLKGDKVKVTVKLNEGKLCCKGDKYDLTMERVGDELKETITFKGHTMIRFSKKM